MQLTLLAKQLVKPTQRAINQVQAVLDHGADFTPSTSVRTFHIGMSNYIAFVLLPKILQHLSRNAPHIKIVQHAINHLFDLKQFEDSPIDMIFGSFPDAPISLKKTLLFCDNPVIAADKNHPVFKGKNWSTEAIAKYPQIFVSLENTPKKNFIADMLKQKGYNIRTSLMTPHTLIALQVLPKTQLLTNTVEHLVKPFAKALDLKYLATPCRLNQYQANLYWYVKDSNDPAHQWLRDYIKNIASTNYQQ